MRKIDDVFAVRAGYIGDTEDVAQYALVATGRTKHREAVEVRYDPAVTSYALLVRTFLYHIDPTDGGGQFADRGHQYSPAIYYQSDEERRIIEREMADYRERKGIVGALAVDIVPFASVPGFFPAESYHQAYYKKNPAHYQAYKEASGRAALVRENAKFLRNLS